MNIYRRTSYTEFNADYMAIVCAIKSHANAGNDFPADMTEDDTASHVLQAICANFSAPTWHFRPVCGENLASRADVTTVGELLYSSLDNRPMPDLSALFADPVFIKCLREYVVAYLRDCRSGRKVPTFCKKIPFVPNLFRAEDEKYTFDAEALRKFEDSLPADAFVPKKQQPRSGSPTRASSLNEMLTSDAVLLFTLRHKYGLAKDDAHNLVSWSHPFGYSRYQIKEIAQQVADNKDPKCTAIDRLIARVVNELDMDHETFMSKVAADGLTKEDTLMFLAEVFKEGFVTVDYS